jgi:hypothetical protein
MDYLIVTRRSIEFNRNSSYWLDVEVLENTAQGGKGSRVFQQAATAIEAVGWLESAPSEPAGRPGPSMKIVAINS